MVQSIPLAELSIHNSDHDLNYRLNKIGLQPVSKPVEQILGFFSEREGIKNVELILKTLLLDLCSIHR